MADGVSTFALTPFVRSAYAGGTQKVAPSVLDLGSYYLTRNVRAESLNRIFARPSSGNVFASVDSFLAVAAQNNLSFGAKDGSAAAKNSVNAAYTAALDLFAKRETPAEARLRELLEAPAPRSSAPAPAPEATLTLAANTGGTLDEGGTFVFSSDALLSTAKGGVNNNIVYNVTGGPENGYLELASDPGAALVSFTQAQVASGLVRYVHNGTDTATDSFSFSVRSGSETLSASFRFEITPADDAPILRANTGATVDEGSFTLLTTAQLNATDVDTANANITYTLASGPSNGRLELTTDPGTAITSFTQTELAAGRVRYVHDDSETVSDSFTFTLSDETTTLAAATFNITVNPVDDGPQLTNTGATVVEGDTLTFDTANLSATDPETGDGDLIFTVTSGPADGYLQLSTDPGVSITTFTQADLAAGLVQYVHNSGENASDSFDFTLSDGTVTLSDTFTLTITGTDDAPALTTNAGATATEGASATLTPAQLNATDVDTAPQDLVYTITAGPVNGHLELSSNPGVAIASFTQEEIGAGLVTYVHDGSETTSDSFSFTLGDQTTTLAAATFNITVNPSDDPPNLTNTGTTVTEGGSRLITPSELGATDVDTPDANLVYTVTTAPASGYLELTTNAGVSITSFTQADLEAGIVNYVHDGSESSTDNFAFSLSDGTNTLSGNTFDIAVTAVDDAPVLAVNSPATSNEGSTVILTTANLSTTDVDTASANLTYTLTSNSSNGYLQYTTSPGTAITSFTQADLEAGIVEYVHNGSETTSDGFTFIVADQTTTLSAAAFSITVNPVNDAPTLTNTGASTAEGASTIISTANLSASDPDTANANLVYTVDTAPANGRLELTTNPGVSITSFTQADLAAGLVRYVHDGSETASDGFGFTLSDGTNTLSGNTFNITVTPVDDAPTLVTNIGATVSRSIGFTIITTVQLSAVDTDTAPSAINFNVTGGLTRGYLELTTNPGTAITSFTQADLIAGRVRYVHTSGGLSDDSFTFTVSDATTTLSAATFNIDVIV